MIMNDEFKIVFIKFLVLIVCNTLKFDLGPKQNLAYIVWFSAEFLIKRLGNAGKKRYRLSLRSR